MDLAIQTSKTYSIFPPSSSRNVTNICSEHFGGGIKEKLWDRQSLTSFHRSCKHTHSWSTHGQTTHNICLDRKKALWVHRMQIQRLHAIDAGQKISVSTWSQYAHCMCKLTDLLLLICQNDVEITGVCCVAVRQAGVSMSWRRRWELGNTGQ